MTHPVGRHPFAFFTMTILGVKGGSNRLTAAPDGMRPRRKQNLANA